MNKELINKYKPEFDHWLKNPDGLLFYDEHHNGWHNLHCDYQWNCTIAEMEEFGKYGYIINDEYSIYRTALAEGKTIQLNGTAVNGGYGETWNDCDKENLFIYGINTYRIKPDEPKFKVGDFVRYAHSTPARALEINNINGGRYYFINSEMSCLEHELEPWTPVKGEWCWFYDNSDSRYSHLAQFYDMYKSSDSSISTFMSRKGLAWNYCEPFLDSRPSYLKDK